MGLLTPKNNKNDKAAKGSKPKESSFIPKGGKTSSANFVKKPTVPGSRRGS
ncbi:hypothetical protein V9K67_02800 [Paraflavisolibacter sp. H34]|uniref:hypothetical protein n=1 Tax=Huijunlia imazamoxiresistens TaxID=3127457 RepID=UPI003018AC65